MKVRVYLGLVVIAVCVSGCESSFNKRDISDHGIDGGTLVDGRANIWTDPDGCQHWYIDDGVEGYMTPRLNRDGTPRCTGGSAATIVTKDGSVIPVES